MHVNERFIVVAWVLAGCPLPQELQQGNDTPGLEECGADCTASYCDELREYCHWGIETPGWFSEYDTCDECVEEFAQGTVDLPNVYCEPVFACWNNCIDQYEFESTWAIEECIDVYCDGINMEGTGLCQP